MRISTSKTKSDALWHLTPAERVALILEYQIQRDIYGNDFEKEIREVQEKMSGDQKNQYAKTAFLVIYTNRTLFDFYLLLTNEFYQTYSGFFQTLLSFITNNTKAFKSLDSITKSYKKKLVEIYQGILACDMVAGAISEETGIRNIIYPCYEKYFQTSNEKIKVLVGSIAKKETFKPDSETQEIIIRTIKQAVSDQLFGGL